MPWDLCIEGPPQPAPSLSMASRCSFCSPFQPETCARRGSVLPICPAPLETRASSYAAAGRRNGVLERHMHAAVQLSQLR